MSNPSIIIQSTGTCVPQKRVTNFDLMEKVDTSDEWIRTRSGIAERRIADEKETPSFMGTQAAKEALKRANLGPEDIDLLIVATMSGDMPFPSTACLIQSALGLRNIPAFDIQAACSGFVYLTEIGKQMLSSGDYQNALIIGTEKMSSLLDWSDRTTCVLFGDGAGAAVLSKSDTPGVGIIGSSLGTDGSNPSLLCMPGGGSARPATEETVRAHDHFLKMNGKEIFKLAVRIMGDATTSVLEKYNISPSKVSCVIPHQANVRIIDSLASRLELPAEKVMVNIDQYGNTSAASIPIALDQALTEGRIRSGDYVVFVAFGAGLTWGANLIKWH